LIDVRSGLWYILERRISEEKMHHRIVWKSAPAVCALLLGGRVAQSAQAATDLNIDLNRITVQARDAADAKNLSFGSSFTGLLKLSLGSGYLNDVMIDGQPQSAMSGTLTGLSGILSLTNGVVTGGNVTVTITGDGGSQVYQATSMSNPSKSVSSFSPYMVVGGAAGMFSGSVFAGVDVSDFASRQLLDASFTLTRFTPAVSGAGVGGSNNVNLDLQVFAPSPSGGGPNISVPEPASGALLGIGVLGLMGRRSRRR
jgi:hypothetical protein